MKRIFLILIMLAFTSPAMAANNVYWLQMGGPDWDNPPALGSVDLTGSQTVNVTTVNAATYDLLETDYILSVTYTTTGAVTSLTIPTAQTIKGRVFWVKDAAGNAGANNIEIDTEGAQTIDGASTYIINSDYGDIMLYCDGTNWLALAN